MIWVLGAFGYVVVWLVFSVYFVRAVCSDTYKSEFSEIELDDMGFGLGISLLWPLLLPAGLVFLGGRGIARLLLKWANHKPNKDKPMWVRMRHALSILPRR